MGLPSTEPREPATVAVPRGRIMSEGASGRHSEANSFNLFCWMNSVLAGAEPNSNRLATAGLTWVDSVAPDKYG